MELLNFYLSWKQLQEKKLPRFLVYVWGLDHIIQLEIRKNVQNVVLGSIHLDQESVGNAEIFASLIFGTYYNLNILIVNGI